MGTMTKLALGLVGQLKPDRVRDRAVAPAVALPAPEKDAGVALMRAIARRASSREFASRALAPQVLSNVLWAAFGINRAGPHKGRTAPSAMGAQEIDVYVALADGLYVYDPAAHALSLVAAVDARKVTGYQDFVDAAPLDLIYVADHSHMSAIPSGEQRLVFSAVCAGAISQNVSLYCASAGLATVVRGWFDRAALAAALKLGRDEHVIVAQTVGYPAV